MSPSHTYYNEVCRSRSHCPTELPEGTLRSALSAPAPGTCPPQPGGLLLTKPAWAPGFQHRAGGSKPATGTNEEIPHVNQDSIQEPDVSGETQQPCHFALTPHQSQTPRPGSLGTDFSYRHWGTGTTGCCWATPEPLPCTKATACSISTPRCQCCPARHHRGVLWVSHFPVLFWQF